MASYSGTDVSACDKAEYAQTCSIVVGEVFEWPFAVKVKNYMNNLADLTKNLLPLAVASTVKNYILNCQEYINFDTGKVTVPATAQAAAWKIYTCQIPMQIAIFADSTTRSKQAQGFSYPQIPDMCVYAQCVGEQNCKYEPDFWDTLSKMNLPVPTNRTMEYNAQSTKADSYVLMDDIRKLRQYTYFSDPANLPKDATPQQIAALQGISKTDAATIQGTLSKKGLIPHYTGLGSSSTPDASTTSDTNLKLNDVPGTDINSIVSDGTYAGDVYLDDGGSIQSRDDSNTNYNIITYNGKTYVQDNGDPTQVYQVTADWNSVRNSPDAGNIYDASGVPYPVSATPSTTPTIVSTQDKINALDTDINQWKNNPAELSKLVNSEKVTAYTPPTKTQFDSMTPDQKAAFTADQIGWLNQIQGINNQLNNLNNPKIQQQTLSEQQVLKDKRDALAGSLCDKAGGCDSLVKSICGTDTTCTNKYLQDGKLTVDFADNTKMADFQGQVSHAQDIYKATASAEQLGNTVQLAFQFFNAQNLMRWMFTDYWTQKWFGKDFSAYFDFDKYKQSLCNPDNPINIAGEDSTPGSVISCSSGMCRPVLTFAAERTPLEYPNGTKYNLYTIVYYIDAGDLRGYSMSYNLHLTGTSPAGASISIKGYVNNVSLTSFSIQTQRKVFSTPLVLNQLCIDFSDPGFPPQDSLQRKTEYCRDVLANAFDTGSPWNPAQDAQAQGYINQIDQNGNRVLSPNVQVVGNTVPPGFME